MLFDFGRLEVGYTVLEYETQCDTEVVIQYDYSESIEDFSEKCEF